MIVESVTKLFRTADQKLRDKLTGVVLNRIAQQLRELKVEMAGAEASGASPSEIAEMHSSHARLLAFVQEAAAQGYHPDIPV